MKGWNFVFLAIYFTLMWWSCVCDRKGDIASATNGPNSLSSSQERQSHDADANVNTEHDGLNSDRHNEKSNKIPPSDLGTQKQTIENQDVRGVNTNETIRKVRRKESEILEKRKASSVDSKATQANSESDKPHFQNSKVNYVEQINLDKITLENQIKVPSKESANPPHVSSEDAVSSESVSETHKSIGSQTSSPSSVAEEMQSAKLVAPEAGETPEQGQLAHSEAMMSFDEWKKMMLAEQEKGGHKVPVPGPPGKKLTSQKRRRNYASYQCGAKIVASNAEAEGASRILNELVDEYMLNPCQAKIWFVIELCESVQASQLELANFELFSSCMKDFAVYSSDNFPTRDWMLLGTFTAAEQRVLQSFPLKQEGFGKFIKIELQSHYGKEHYCPLSLVHIFGTSMVDEYEEMETLSHHPTLHDDELDRLDFAVEDKGSTNLLGSATDAVYNILKKAAQALVHQSADGDTDASVEQNQLDVERCKLMNSDCNIPNKTSQPPISKSPRDFLVSVGAIHRTLFHHIKHCKQCVKESRPSYHSVSQPQCRFFQAALGPVLFTTICEWFRDHHLATLYQLPIINKTDNTSIASAKPTSPPPSVIQVIIDSNQSESVSLPTFQDSIPTVQKSDFAKVVSDAPSSPKPVISTSTTSELKIDSEIKPTKTISDTPESHDFVNTKPDASFVVSELSRPLSEESTPSTDDITISGSLPTNNYLDGEEVLISSFTSIPSKESPTLSASNETRTVPDIEATPDVSFVDSATVTIIPSDVTSDELLLTEDLKSVEERFADAKDSSIKVESIVIGGSSPGQKESVFVRMNNRIKSLELNMSLSSQYLQELSQRYRRQMEEMQRAFNRTIGTLNDTAKKAAEKEVKQQEVIRNLQDQVANLTLAVDMLIMERSTLTNKVLQQHLCLMIAQMIVMVTIMSLCVRRTSSTTATRVSESSPVSQSCRKRRSSANSPSPQSAAKLKKRSSSAEVIATDNVSIVQQNSQMPPPPPPPPPLPAQSKGKKRNRKKKSIMQRSLSNPSMSPSKSATSPAEKAGKKEESAAGIIFSHTDAKKTMEDSNYTCENCNRNKATGYIAKNFVNISENKRKNNFPFTNLTNGDLHNALLVEDLDLPKRRDKFSFKKFLKFQKRESI